MEDLPRQFTIRESSHRIHNPLTPGKLAALGAVLRLPLGTRVLDLACRSGELLWTWVRDHGVAGTVELLRRSLEPGGIMLVGEPYWRKEPPDRETVEGSSGIARDEWAVGLGNLLGSFGELGLDVVEMVLADGDSWDRYEAAKWLNVRRWLDANPGDELYGEMRAELRAAPVRHARHRREYLGWCVFALMDR
jgi:hypothetical protein